MASADQEIRVGMVRADKRALWYGAILDEIDPEVYAALDPAAYHHLTYYSSVELHHRRATGFRLTRVYDPDTRRAEQLQTAFRGRPQVCQSLTEVTEDVDLVFIANETSDGSDHVRLASRGLGRGVPTFIDRPLARSLRQCRALIRLAQQNRTPLLSCSHLRFLPQVEQFRRRFAELEPIERGTVHGRGPNPAEIADGIELGLCLFGYEFPVHSRQVQSMGEWPLETVLVTLTQARTGRQAHVLLVNPRMGGERYAFHASASSNLHQIYLDDLEAFVQSEGGLGVMMALRDMVRCGKPPLPYADMLLPIAVAEAGRRAHNTARAVNVASQRAFTDGASSSRQ